MATSSILTHHDHCSRAGWRSLRVPPGPVGPLPVLREAVDIGLGSEDDRGERAAMAVRDAALHGRLEVESKETLYVLAEHLASIAEQIVYVVGGDKPWVRPDPIWLAAGVAWEPGVWVDGSGEGLRRVVLTGYQSSNENLSWFEQGEQAVYGGALTEIVVALGSQREGRFHGYWSKGWKHPRSKEVRLADAMGGEFRTWNPVWRESERIDAAEWAEKMQSVMHSALRIEQHEPLGAGERRAWKSLALYKLQEMNSGKEPPPQISQCKGCAYGPCPLTETRQVSITTVYPIAALR